MRWSHCFIEVGIKDMGRGLKTMLSGPACDESTVQGLCRRSTVMILTGDKETPQAVPSGWCFYMVCRRLSTTTNSYPAAVPL